MGEEKEEAKKVETVEHVAEEKAIVLSTLPPSKESEGKPDYSKALAIVEPENSTSYLPNLPRSSTSICSIL